MHSVRRQYTAALTVALAGCASSTPDPADGSATWRIDSVPLVAIADAEADTVALLGNVIGVTAIGDSQFVVGSNRVRWTMFDPAGTEIGSLDLPVTFEVDEIGPTTVLGVETRLDDGAQEVRMYQLWRK